MRESVTVTLAQDEGQIAACFPLMRQLRPELEASEFVATCRQLMQEQGYRLLLARAGETILGVAGYRLGRNLAWGRHLYVDDLAVASESRGEGVGRALMNELRRLAREAACGQLHLDCGLQRSGAHRFYKRIGLTGVAQHYVEMLDTAGV
ncbi:GNAT family N-acetyltransferase [Magnetofaba australis]|uniref:Putative GCN5-like N-acetyltransferase n=1 Tax=Magnetofaba australis IT-1 TaxID=1434232 RepID=A0A1Y2K1I2_9PROT|nr:GNAT family N-acetyltransferase [Magnetofaba australis]OSM01486.1 putative GCN5-like N-acetyltransferase [Magnetofaba australis IT-1]